jgi:sugar lactone lactonase YvrE
VADWTGPAVAKLAPTGALLAEWRGPEHFGLFHHPAAVAVAASDTIYVADEGSHTVHALTPQGEPLARWGGEGSALGRLRAPRAVGLDAQANVYVADTGNARVQKLSPTGCWLAAWGSLGRGPGQLWTPTGLAVDSAGYLYVADAGNARLLKLAPTGEPLAQWGGPHRLVVRRPADLPHAGDPAPWHAGALYHLDGDDGRLAVARILATDNRAIHLRLYQQRFTRRLPDAKLPPLTLDDPGDDGLGLAHLPVTPRLFAAWQPAFIPQSQRRPLPSDTELRAYRAWQRTDGSIWDLDAPLAAP